MSGKSKGPQVGANGEDTAEHFRMAEERVLLREILRSGQLPPNGLDPLFFDLLQHRLLAAAILELHRAEKPITAAAVALAAKGEVDEIWLAELAAGGSATTSASPLPGPLNGVILLDNLRSFLARYVVLPAPHLDVVPLWILHAHAIAAADTTARLVIKSPEKESGKTRLLEVLELLVPTPLFALNATVAAIFRLLATEQATLLFDEVDAVFGVKGAKEHEDLRALLNAGYRRGATVARVVGEGKGMRVERFPAFAATALAAIGDLPDTVESRGIIMPMRRRAPDEPVAPFRRRQVVQEATPLRDWCAGWAARQLDTLAAAVPEMPAGVTDRAADCWEPLLAIADLAGGDWPKRARAAAQTIVAGRLAEDQSLGVRLLADINVALDGCNRLASADLTRKLNAMEEAPWGGFRECKGLDQRLLARRLKPFGISPKVIKLPDGSTARGYLRDQFLDSFARYLRLVDPALAPAPTGVTSVTSVTQIRIPVTEVADVTLPSGREADRVAAPEEDLAGSLDSIAKASPPPDSAPATESAKSEATETPGLEAAQEASVASGVGPDPDGGAPPNREAVETRAIEDPRDDLLEDSPLWVAVLSYAHAFDGQDREGSYGSLHTARCLGARLARVDGKLRMFPPTEETEWPEFRERWLRPQAGAIARLLREMEDTHHQGGGEPKP